VSDDRDARLRIRAYEIWQERGSPDGRAVEHWLEAERQLRGEEPARSSDADTESTQSKPPAQESERQGDLAPRGLVRARAAAGSAKS
jgi:hypothetical protein